MSGGADGEQQTTQFAGIVIHGPKSVFDQDKKIKGWLGKSGNNVEVLWTDNKDHNVHIGTIFKWLQESGAEIPTFFQAKYQPQLGTVSETSSQPSTNDQSGQRGETDMKSHDNVQLNRSDPSASGSQCE